MIMSGRMLLLLLAVAKVGMALTRRKGMKIEKNKKGRRARQYPSIKQGSQKPVPDSPYD